jgi:hypothetical protein
MSLDTTARLILLLLWAYGAWVVADALGWWG